MTEKDSESRPTNFIRQIIDRDLADGSTNGRVVTRFPPEPNGQLHIGHAKSICLNFGLANDYDGTCHLRFDDTNPTTEDIAYVEAIKADIHWLGFDWQDKLFFASDYFEQLYEYAEQVIRDGNAYVDSSTEEQIREMRGTVTEPGKPSLYRSRSVEANLSLFREMREGKYPDGAHVLRAKIDLAASNMKMRDPLLYRIRHAHHYRTGDDWCIYPFYDWAHPLSDAIEGITHSLCTLEFENNRVLYDWVVDAVRKPPRPHQYEFARLGLNYTVMSKRKFIKLVDGGYVSGWDDPRMPTIAGMRRRGYTPEAIRDFSEGVGVARANTQTEVAALEYAVRNNLNPITPRAMCVVDPVKVVITNYSAPDAALGHELLDAPLFPNDSERTDSRKVPFSQELYIERADFMEDPPKRFHRLSPGQEVRLRYACIIKCTGVKKDTDGRVVELECEYDPETISGGTNSDRKVRGTIHWVSAATAVPCELRLYDRLFAVPNPGEGEKEFVEDLNPDSAVTIKRAWVEPSVLNDPAETRYQFERQGYFWRDPADSSEDNLVFNRIVSLKDSWAKIADKRTAKSTTRSGNPGDSDSTGNKRQKRREKTTADSANKEQAPLSAVARNLMSAHGLDERQARSLNDDDSLRMLFDAVVPHSVNPISTANWIINEVPPVTKSLSISGEAVHPKRLAELVDLVELGTITNLVAEELLPEIVQGASASHLVAERGLATMQDSDALDALVSEVISSFPEKVADYRSGKTGLIGFFMGQVMQKSGGRADPAAVRSGLTAALQSE